MLVVNQLIGFGVAGFVPVALDYRTAGGSGFDLSAYTFSSVDIGTASAGRYVIVSFTGTNVSASRSVSSVTIGGVTATQLLSSGASGGGAFIDFAVYIAKVPTGTTGDIVITWSAAQLRCGYAVWAATGVLSTTAVDTASGSTATSTAQTRDVNTLLGGAVIGSSTTNSSGTATWAGLTEQADSIQYDSTDTTVQMSTAHADNVAAETPRTVTCALTAGDPRVSWTVSIR